MNINLFPGDYSPGVSASYHLVKRKLDEENTYYGLRIYLTAPGNFPEPIASRLEAAKEQDASTITFWSHSISDLIGMVNRMNAALQR